MDPSAPLTIQTVTVHFIESWVREKIYRTLNEHKRYTYDIEPVAVILDPKTAVQLSWELTGKYLGIPTEIFGLPIRLGLGTDRIELVFDEDALLWLMWKQQQDKA